MSGDIAAIIMGILAFAIFVCSGIRIRKMREEARAQLEAKYLETDAPGAKSLADNDQIKEGGAVK